GRAGALRADDEEVGEVREVDVELGDLDVLQLVADRIADHGTAGLTGVKRQGMRLMPWMNADSSMAGGPLIAMSGSCWKSSSNITAISRRARLAPRQKCGPPPPKPT